VNTPPQAGTIAGLPSSSARAKGRPPHRQFHRPRPHRPHTAVLGRDPSDGPRIGGSVATALLGASSTFGIVFPRRRHRTRHVHGDRQPRRPSANDRRRPWCRSPDAGPAPASSPRRRRPTAGTRSLLFPTVAHPGQAYTAAGSPTLFRTGRRPRRLRPLSDLTFVPARGPTRRRGRSATKDGHGGGGLGGGGWGGWVGVGHDVITATLAGRHSSRSASSGRPGPGERRDHDPQGPTSRRDDRPDEPDLQPDHRTALDLPITPGPWGTPKTATAWHLDDFARWCRHQRSPSRRTTTAPTPSPIVATRLVRLHAVATVTVTFANAPPRRRSSAAGSSPAVGVPRSRSPPRKRCEPARTPRAIHLLVDVSKTHWA